MRNLVITVFFIFDDQVALMRGLQYVLLLVAGQWPKLNLIHSFIHSIMIICIYPKILIPKNTDFTLNVRHSAEYV